MPKFGNVSLTRLGTCDQRLRDICHETIKFVDFTVVCGHRGEVAQTLACAHGLSKTPWPTSKHNSLPSRAVDVAPYKDGAILWRDKDAFQDLAKEMLAAAHKLDVKLRWGGDWDGDGDTLDEKFLDMPHFELVGD